MLTSLVLVILSLLAGTFAGIVTRDRIAVTNQRGFKPHAKKNDGAWVPFFIVNNGRRHEVALAPSGDVWMRFDRMLLAKHAGAEVPEWIATSEKKGAFIGTKDGQDVCLRAWTARLFGNEGVMRLHAPIVAGDDGNVPAELELDPGMTEDKTANFVDALVARLDSEAEGLRYRTQGSTVTGGRKKADTPF